MADILSRVPLSGAAATFAPIAITTSAATVHTATSESGYVDDVWMHAFNTTAATIRLTMTKCGVTFYIDVPPAGAPLTRIFDGVEIAAGGTITALASGTGVIIDGHVNRGKAS